jgi:RNA polymerase sigma-70 factor (ECF subfamily)
LLTVAKRRAIDRLRRAATLERRAVILDSLITQEESEMDDSIPDDCLKLMFTCCHSALALEAQVALTLHTLGGLSTREVARAFLVPAPTTAQRLARARKKFVTRVFLIACRQPISCPNGWTRCWRSFT